VAPIAENRAAIAARRSVAKSADSKTLAQKRLGPAERGRGRQSTGRRIRLERKRTAHEVRAHGCTPRDGLAGAHDLAP